MESRQAAAIVQELDAHRPAGASTWEMPGWGSPLAAGIFPFAVRTNDRAIPLGTAFCISKLGLVCSAYHVVHECLKFHPRGDQLRKERWLSDSADISPLSFDVLHRHGTRFTLWPLRTLQGGKPTDIIVAHPHIDGTLAYLALPLSFAVPRVGTRVTAVGYGGMETGSLGISTEKLAAGDTSELERAGLQLNVVEGRVSRIFTQRFAAGYIEGACFEMSGTVLPGMSGGPVFNEAGYVCGVVAAGAGIYSENGGSIVSLLYPLVQLDVTIEAVMGSVSVKSEQPMIELVTSGSIDTDGSEEELPITYTAEGRNVGVRIAREDHPHVFDDLLGAQDGAPASRAVGPISHYRRLDKRGK